MAVRTRSTKSRRARGASAGPRIWVRKIRSWGELVDVIGDGESFRKARARHREAAPRGDGRALLDELTQATLFPGIDGLARSMAYEFEYSWEVDPTTGKPRQSLTNPQAQTRELRRKLARRE